MTNAITVTGASKRYGDFSALDNVDFVVPTGSLTALLGPSGSGKSTLLQIIAGAVMHSEGSIEFKSEKSSQINNDIVHQHLSIVAPYLELIEEMTANEFLYFHNEFKKLSHSFKEILSITGLENAADKQIRYYSSGMKQRLKLAQAFFSETPVLLLDEPTSNLDEDGIRLYKMLINNYTKGRLVIETGTRLLGTVLMGLDTPRLLQQ